MTDDEGQRDQTYEQIERMRRALDALERDILPVNRALYELMAEGPRDEIARLQAEIDGIESRRELLRKLFVDDAMRGFAFVDVCRQRFDVVLMNPPFGAAGKPSKSYIDGAYPRTKNDVYAAFVERGLERLTAGGLLGAITSRTGFFLSSFQKWREEILLNQSRPTVFADLGYGVLDTAMVETAAYCLVKCQ